MVLIAFMGRDLLVVTRTFKETRKNHLLYLIFLNKVLKDQATILTLDYPEHRNGIIIIMS